MIQCLHRGESDVWALYQQLGDQVLRLFRYLFPDNAFKTKFVFFDAVENLIRGLALEGESVTQHKEEQDPYRPEVASVVIGFPEELWSNVVRGPDHACQPVGEVTRTLGRQSKIAKLNSVVIRVLRLEQDVFSFDISMSNLQRLVHVV